MVWIMAIFIAKNISDYCGTSIFYFVFFFHRSLKPGHLHYNLVFSNFYNEGFKEGKMACCGSGPYRGVVNCGGKGSVKEYELCGNPSDYVFFWRWSSNWKGLPATGEAYVGWRSQYHLALRYKSTGYVGHKWMNYIPQLNLIMSSVLWKN